MFLKRHRIMQQYLNIFEFCEKNNYNKKVRNLVCLCWSGYYTPHTHQRYPTTARRLQFELPPLGSGPIPTYLDNLVNSGSPKLPMLTPSLVRTLIQRKTKYSRAPVLKPSSSSGLALASITGPATDPSHQIRPKFDNIKLGESMQVSWY